MHSGTGFTQSDLNTLAFRCLSLTAASPGKPPGCYLAPEAGPCEALQPRYYYNPATDGCEKFYYGGCGGNFNRFATLEECLQTCGGLAPNGES